MTTLPSNCRVRGELGMGEIVDALNWTVSLHFPRTMFG